MVLVCEGINCASFMKFKYVLFVMMYAVLTSCNTQSDRQFDNISLDLDIKRLDIGMYQCAGKIRSDSTLNLFETYREFFQEDREYYIESLGIPVNRMREGQVDSLLARTLIPLVADSSMYQLLDTIQQVFPADYPFEQQMLPLLKRLVGYLGEDSLEIPPFRMFANGFVPKGDSRSIDQLQVLPSYYGIGLHYFLGKGYPFYPANVPVYIRKRFDKIYLPVLVASSISEGMVPEVNPRSQPTLIDHMVRKGIAQFFLDKLLPDTPDSLKFFYTSEQMAWAERFEPALFKEIIPDLYSTDYLQYRDYLEERPFSAQISQEAPPRIGQFLGWKIVRAYIEENPSISLAELIASQDYTGIFKSAKYRP